MLGNSAKVIIMKRTTTLTIALTICLAILLTAITIAFSTLAVVSAVVFRRGNWKTHRV